jgi:hypothetical protein
MIKRVFLLVMLLAATGWADSQVKIGGITWFTDYDQALAYARKQNKPLWLHFGEDPG